MLTLLSVLATATALGRQPAVAAARVSPAVRSDPALALRIESQLKRGGLRGARVGILIADAATGEVLYERDADQLLVPASLTKAVLSAAVLHELHPEYRYRTALFGLGQQTGSTWHGDLWLKSWGDPALDEARVWLLVDELRRRGVRSIEGKIRVDDSYFDRRRFGEDWGTLSRAWYDAPHGAVSVNGNTIESRGRFVAIEGDPSDHAGRYLLDMMRNEGIAVSGGLGESTPVPEAARPVAASESKPLTGILSDLNKVSNNFIAEQLLKTLGAEVHGAPGTAEKGLDVVARYLRAIGVADGAHKLFDGSGLSKSNRLSARALVRVFQAVQRDFSIAAEYVASLKVAGVDGRHARFQDWLCKRRMRVKTGHLFGAAGLAGYAETLGGRRLVFSIIANDYRRGRRAADRGIEDICEAFLTLGAASDPAIARAPLGPADLSAPAEARAGGVEPRKSYTEGEGEGEDGGGDGEDAD